MMPGGGDWGNLLKKAQEMQDNMQKEQEKLNDTMFKGSAGGGIAEVEVNGKLELVSLKIMPEAVDPDDVEMLEDVILAAIKDAQKQASDQREQGMSSLMGGMNIPGLF
jgi:DNA-binding YbaB/EbfC family protein